MATVLTAVNMRPLWPPLSPFTQLWTRTLSGLHCPPSLSCEHVPSLASTVPVHSAVNEYLLGLHCPSSHSFEWVPSLASIVPVHSAVNECPLWPPLSQFTPLWMNIPLASTVPVLSAVNEYSLWPPLFQVTQLWTCTLSGLHCASSHSCERVPLRPPLSQFTQLWMSTLSVASIVPGQSAVNMYPLWPPLSQFTQLWMSALSGLHCPVHSAVNEYPLWPPLPLFTQLWMKNVFSGLLYFCSQSWMNSLSQPSVIVVPMASDHLAVFECHQEGHLAAWVKELQAQTSHPPYPGGQWIQTEEWINLFLNCTQPITLSQFFWDVCFHDLAVVL